MFAERRFSAQFARHKRWVFQVGPRVVLRIERHHAREVHRTIGAHDLPFVHFEVHAEPVDDIRICALFHLQPHSIAFAAVMQLCTDAFEQRPRLLLLEVEIAVAGYSKGRG